VHDEVDCLEVWDEGIEALGETDYPHSDQTIVGEERVELVVIRQGRSVDTLLLARFHEANVREADHHPDHRRHEGHTRNKVLESGVGRSRDRSEGEHRETQRGQDRDVWGPALVGDRKDFRQVAVLMSAFS
jgi:hypothetical protein